MRAAAARLRLLVFDVDGVLTDGSIVWTSGGEEIKTFHVRDGYGLVAARKAGLELAILSGRTSAVTDLRARELGITRVIQGSSDKGAGMRELLSQTRLAREQALMMGDDLPDLAAFALAGVRVAPADAVQPVHEAADWITVLPGGRGAVRECVDFILAARGQ